MIKDSGNRREFESGAVRDIQEGKGRCDLLPLREVSFLLDSITLYNIYLYQSKGREKYLYYAIEQFCIERGWSKAEAIREVSIHFEEGAKKYGERNWQKGIPEHCYIDSAVRHYLKWQDNWDDEPHDRAVVWNLLCLIWTHDNIEQ